MKSLFRRCPLWIPVATTFHSASYPLSERFRSIPAKSLPESADSSPGTFSISTHSGRTQQTTRQNSGQSHLSSSLPFLFPAQLTGWQGNPPQTTSTLPRLSNSSLSSFVISSKHGTPGQCFAKTFLQNGSISQKAIVSNPPVLCKPKENPPIPENKSKTVNFSIISPPEGDIPILRRRI